MDSLQVEIKLNNHRSERMNENKYMMVTEKHPSQTNETLKTTENTTNRQKYVCAFVLTMLYSGEFTCLENGLLGT